MKTLQEQFNLIQEGKGHKDMFMKSARRLFPQYITNFATYKEATTILKQRGVISETIVGGGLVTIGNPFANWAQYLAEEAKAVEKQPTKEVTDMETRDFDYKNKKNIDNVYGQEFLNGYYAEMKDPKNENKTVDEVKEMVAKNLAKDCNYYVTNQAFGIKGIGYTDTHPGLGPTKEVKGKYASSGMEPVKIKEEMIKLTDLLNEGIGGYVDIAPNVSNVSLNEKEDQEEKYVGDDEKYEYEKGKEAGEKEEKAKVKKEGLEHRLKEIESAGNVAALEAKMNAIDEEIMAREGKLSMVQENDAIAEFINPARVKEIQREIKALEGAKTKYGKMYEKVAGKAYVKKEVVDETDESGY